MRFISIIMLVLFSGSAFASGDVHYQVSFDNAAHHEAEISATFTGIEDAILEVRMSRTSPGRYALHEYAKNVYNVKAVNSKGEPLSITRPNPYEWDISDHDGEVTVSYTLFADRADGTYSQVDRTHAHLNIPATFIWSKQFVDSPVQVNFMPYDDSWKVATQLVKTGNPFEFTAPNFAYFMDSPVELSDHQVREWSVRSNNKDYTIKLALHHDGTEDELDEYAAQAEAVVDEHVKVYGELPDFDYGEYVFIACYLPHVSGDGMEHRNSTVLTNSSSLEESEFGQLGTLSHEFFHIWNVERIRPKTLEPFDFTGQNMTKNLWFAEGFTQYYGGLLIRRAGESSVDDYLETVSDIVNQANSVPGRLYFSPEGASMMATFTDAGTAIDRTNFRNIFFSYYIYGRSRALALDLTIRAKYPGKSLDDYMALMWADFGKNEKPYDRDDLRVTLGKLLDDTAFADKFFADYISGKKVPDYETL
ncbi:MAG: M61 family metallopeptidase, partial [Kordiimonadaceae bacterium]|nr:M61 family metallopeptidase [Kordiimonadaceae bacterium]